ncbi:uncharacterized protein [Amphiura filiformis]|uniref:uncharacterized protein n=1 Tax=Amphiura filiformis TaxID=82378 RepID=UPI003B20BAD4
MASKVKFRRKEKVARRSYNNTLRKELSDGSLSSRNGVILLTPCLSYYFYSIKQVGVGAIDSNGARYGAVVFASRHTVVFHLSDPYNTKEEVKLVLDEALREKNADKIGRGSGMREALGAVKDEMIARTPLRGRVEAKSAVFVITDGKANEGGSPVDIAMQLKEDFGMYINCIGVGEFDKNELANIASMPHSEHLFLLEYYDKAGQLAAAVTKTEYAINNGSDEVAQTVIPCQADSCEVWETCIDASGTPMCFCNHPLECERIAKSVVCGTDGRNYTNLCQLKSMACFFGSDVELVKQTPCSPEDGCLNMDPALTLEVPDLKDLACRTFRHFAYKTSVVAKLENDTFEMFTMRVLPLKTGLDQEIQTGQLRQFWKSVNFDDPVIEEGNDYLIVGTGGIPITDEYGIIIEYRHFVDSGFTVIHWPNRIQLRQPETDCKNACELNTANNQCKVDCRRLHRPVENTRREYFQKVDEEFIRGCHL